MPRIVPALRETLLASVAAELPSLQTFYRHLHAHPELSFQEAATSLSLAGQLQQAGAEVTRNVGGHGVVGVLRNGAGPVLMLRTDMDALPVEERTGLPYASTTCARDAKGETVKVMHACGHDMHMTVFAGTVRHLARFKEHWSGTLVAVAQPAEEWVSGARAMLSEGLFERFPRPGYCLGLHVSPSLPAGTVGCVEGCTFASVDTVEILVRGQGGHGAFPQACKDPVVLAAELVLALQTIISREISPLEPAVLTVGSIHGGTASNIIPQAVRLELTVRAFSDDVRQHILKAIQRLGRGLGLAAGLPEHLLPVVSTAEESTPATYNEPALTQRLAGVFASWLGTENVFTEKPILGGEDFGLYGRTEHGIPLCFYWLGSADPERVRAAKNGGEPLPPLHSPFYWPVPEPTITTGVTAMTAAALDLLGKEEK